ncbi:helix-turn-helix domain-containing protein [Lysinibacillus sp. RC79]|uniref:helix-turn-helix domain-containing protein n=1 Tax=Lysinibacillus sp. RC79 TaxID=3156296 RepID=UPI003517AC30
MFGKNLAKLRKDSKLSQYELAERMKLSRGQIANYEQGKRQPDFATLLDFAEFFGVSTDYLLTGQATGQLTLLPNEYGIFENSDNTRFPIRLKKAMLNKEMDVERLAKILGVKEDIINFYLKIPTIISYKEEEMVLLEKIALILDIPMNQLLGRDEPSVFKTSKDERDIAKRLESFRHEIENSDGLAFDGEPMSDEAKESLIESMEHIFRQTQRINKKYTPKKYRDE